MFLYLISDNLKSIRTHAHIENSSIYASNKMNIRYYNVSTSSIKIQFIK